MGTQQINCIVRDCYYYGQGNKCQAEGILVTNDHFAESSPADMDFEAAAEFTPVEASNSMNTSCKTYKPRNSADVPIGGA